MWPLFGGARRQLAKAVAAFVVVGTVATGVVGVLFDVAFTNAGRPDLKAFGGVDIVFFAAVVASAAVGASLLLRRPEHPVGWCFALLATSINVAGISESYAKYGLFLREGGLPADDLAAVLANSVFMLWLIAIALVWALTPSGRHLSVRWRRASQVMAVSGLAWLALRLISSAPLEPPFDTVINPWAVDGPELGPLRLALAILNNVLLLAAAASLVLRFRRSQGDERRQLLWMAVIVGPFLALVIVAFVAAVNDKEGIVSVAAAGIVSLPPIGAWLAIERFRLYEVDRILSRTLGYLAASALMAAIYSIAVLLMARLIGQTASRSPTAIALATLAAVITFRPVHAAVQDFVDRHFARRRYDAVGQVSAFLADPVSRTSVEGVLRAALGDASLRVAYPLAGSDHWVTEDGLLAQLDDNWHHVVRAERTVAAISHSSDQSLFDSVVSAASTELDNAGLRAAIALQLQEVVASRRRIAHAQLDERRRIERDLHDGAQQRLLGTAAQLQAGLLNGDPARMRAALESGILDCRQAVVELRELANGLHPATLTDGGLAAALEQLPVRFPTCVTVEVPQQRYPAEIETTLWFVTCEAVVNAVKHAHPSIVQVRLVDVGGALRLTVDDDGCGGADATGNGLRGLADRVEAIGGQLHVLSHETWATRVEAVVPCVW